MAATAARQCPSVTEAWHGSAVAAMGSSYKKRDSRILPLPAAWPGDASRLSGRSAAW